MCVCVCACVCVYKEEEKFLKGARQAGPDGDSRLYVCVCVFVYVSE